MTLAPQPIDPIAAAIALAQATAANSVALQAQNLVPATVSNTPVAIRPGVAMTMDELMIGQMAVDQWIGVKEFGFIFGKDKTLYSHDIVVEIDMDAVLPNLTVKYGNPAVYVKTYDHAVSNKGTSWADAVASAQRVDPKVRPYPSADIPMTLLHPVVDGGKEKKVLAEEGTVLGYSLSTTNFPFWSKFYKSLMVLGIQKSVVKVALSYEKKTNSNNNVWGVITFTYVPDSDAVN